MPETETLFTCTSKVSGWKAVIDALFQIHDEPYFQVSDEGIQFYVKHISGWALLSLFWKKENMTYLKVNNELWQKDLEKNSDKKQSVKFVAADMVKILKRFSNNDEEITIQYTTARVITISSGKREFEIRTIVTEPSAVSGTESSLDYKEPTIEHQVSIKIESNNFKNAILDAMIFSDNSKIQTKDGSITIMSASQDGKANIPVIGEITKQENIETNYSLEMISNMVSSLIPFSVNIIMEYSEIKPMLLIFDIKDIGLLRYHLAPRNMS